MSKPHELVDYVATRMAIDLAGDEGLSSQFEEAAKCAVLATIAHLERLAMVAEVKIDKAPTSVFLSAVTHQISKGP